MNIFRTLLAATALTLCAFHTQAQQRERFEKAPANNVAENGVTACPKAYLGLSTGINNNSGILGINLDVPVMDELSIGVGVGLSSWGTKFYGEGRYYFEKNCHRGWALGVGVTHNTGVEGVELEGEDVYGRKTDIIIDAKAKTNAMFSVYRFWSLGRRKVSRFYVQLGYSIPFSKTEYVVTNGVVLSKEADRTVRAISPGGIILGTGFSFGL